MERNSYTCIHCKHDSSEHITYESHIGSYTCSSCGRVHSRSMLRVDEDEQEGRKGSNEGIYIPHYKPYVPLVSTRVSNQSHPPPLSSPSSSIARTHTVLHSLCSRLGLPHEVSTQALHILTHCFSELTSSPSSCVLPGGVRGTLFCGASVSYICRSQHRALSLLDIADILQCNLFKLGAAFNQLQAMLQAKSSSPCCASDPSVFVDRALASALNITADSSLHSSTVLFTSLRSACLSLLHVSSLFGLSLGRSERGLIGAAVCLSLDARGVAYKPENLARSLHCAQKTIKERKKEFIQALLSLAERYLPFLLPSSSCDIAPLSSSTKSSVKKFESIHLEFIVENLNLILEIQKKEEILDYDKEALQSEEDNPVAAVAAQASTIVESVDSTNDSATPCVPSPPLLRAHSTSAPPSHSCYTPSIPSTPSFTSHHSSTPLSHAPPCDYFSRVPSSTDPPAFRRVSSALEEKRKRKSDSKQGAQVGQDPKEEIISKHNKVAYPFTVSQPSDNERIDSCDDDEEIEGCIRNKEEIEVWELLWAQREGQRNKDKEGNIHS